MINHNRLLGLIIATLGMLALVLIALALILARSPNRMDSHNHSAYSLPQASTSPVEDGASSSERALQTIHEGSSRGDSSSSSKSESSTHDAVDSSSESLAIHDPEYRVEVSRLERNAGEVRARVVATYAQGRRFSLELWTGPCPDCYKSVGEFSSSEFLEEHIIALPAENRSLSALRLRVVEISDGFKVISHFPDNH